MGCFLLIPGSFLLPPANEVWGKVKCLHLSVILSTGGDAWSRGCLVLMGCAWSRGEVPGPGGSGPRWGVPGLGESGQGGVCLVQGVWSWGVCLVGGAGSWGGAWWRPPRWLLLRVVRILLECILVLQSNWYGMTRCCRVVQIITLWIAINSTMRGLER